jgi:hypothetical protein
MTEGSTSVVFNKSRDKFRALEDVTTIALKSGGRSKQYYKIAHCDGAQENHTVLRTKNSERKLHGPTRSLANGNTSYSREGLTRSTYHSQNRWPKSPTVQDHQHIVNHPPWPGLMQRDRQSIACYESHDTRSELSVGKETLLISLV